jgi:crotonobetainyl-CoA:carnitine CoA-transferase CaiB-like acyl-CoA transferase
MSLDAVEEILASVRFESKARPGIRGADPVLPIPYRVGAAGAAALGALGLGVARLWELRGGRPQAVSVDLRAAVASLRSARYMRINGEAPKIWDPMSGIYPVKDGWISLHCNFPNHRHSVLKVLNVEEDREKAERQSASWSGLELEDAVHAAGGCAAFVRSDADWARHPQAQALAAQPLVEITRIGDAPPEPLAKAKRPLSGVRVLDLTRVLAGPTCARSLAEHGADVLKVSAGHLPDSGLVDLDTGIGKLSARLDLRSSKEASVLRSLVTEADVFSQSYRPGALATRGFSPAALAALRPGIVCISLSAWGGAGPWRQRRGFDTIVQCASGMAQRIAREGKPRYLPVSAIDYTTGYLMAFGATVALARRAGEGGSWLVSVSLARVGRFIVDQGLVPESEYRNAPEDLPEAELASLMAEMDSPSGRIRHLKPVLRLPDTPPYWSRPPVELGAHPAEWPPREG